MDTVTTDWETPFSAALAYLEKQGRPPRLAVLGIGHELRGDDAAGLLLARALKAHAAGRDHVAAWETGPAPENFTGSVRRFAPDLVLLVDAAEMDAAPGEVRWLDWHNLSGISASTHTMPLDIIAAYLTSELGCEVGFLGIQPINCLVDAPVSAEVQAAVDHTARSIMALLMQEPRVSNTPPVL